jgi:hypothetical protein
MILVLCRGRGSLALKDTCIEKLNDFALPWIIYFFTLLWKFGAGMCQQLAPDGECPFIKVQWKLFWFWKLLNGTNTF